MADPRSPQEIRASIEANRLELARSLETLRTEVAAVTDLRAWANRYRRELIIGAGVAGFVLGGGIAAVGGLFRRR